MKRICKIAGIIVTALVTLANICRLIPKQTKIGEFVNGLIDFLVTNPLCSTLISVLLSCLGIFVIFIMVESFRDECSTYAFDTGSKKFYKFFTKWYSQGGTLSIICDDIDWTKSPNDDSIFNALKKKSEERKLNLLIDSRKLNSELVGELKNAGANVVSVSQNIITNYSFSCISVMGNNSAVIVRNKQKDKKKTIKFKEISNNYVTGLLNALIEEDSKSEKNTSPTP